MGRDGFLVRGPNVLTSFLNNFSLSKYLIMNPRFLIASLLLMLSPATSFAHSLWVLVPQGESKTVKLWYSDHPEPGRASMIQRVINAKVWSVNSATNRQSVPVKKNEVTAETAEMTAGISSNAQLLTAVCDIGVKQSRQRSQAAKPPKEVGQQDGKSSQEGTRPRQAGNRKPEPPTREWYFCKYATSEVVAKNDSQELLKQETHRLDLVPQLDGQSLLVTVYFEGKPTPGAGISITDAKGERHRLTTDEHGKVTLNDASPGRYAIRSKKELDESGELKGQAYEKTALVSSLILDIK